VFFRLFVSSGKSECQRSSCGRPESNQILSTVVDKRGRGKLTRHDLLSSKHLLLHLLPHLGRNEKVVGCSLPGLKVEAEGINRLIEVVVGRWKWSAGELLREEGGIGPWEGGRVASRIWVELCSWERLAQRAHGKGVGIDAIVLPGATCVALLRLAKLFQGCKTLAYISSVIILRGELSNCCWVELNDLCVLLRGWGTF
jgi:hypothetical protein